MRVEAEVAGCAVGALGHRVDLREANGLEGAHEEKREEELVLRGGVMRPCFSSASRIHLTFCGVERPHGSKPTLPVMPSRWAGDSFHGSERDLANIDTEPARGAE